MRSLAFAAVVLVASCAPAGVPAPEREPVPSGPTLSASRISPAAQDSARTLFDEAVAARDAGLDGEAEAAASRVVRDFPGSRVSVDALWLRAGLRARAVTEAASSDPSAVEGARSDLERMLRVLPATDPRTDSAAVALGRVQAAGGDVAAGLRTVLTRSGTGAPDPELTDWVREAAGGLTPGQLEGLLEAADPGQPLRIPVLLEYARSLRLTGDEEGARRFAASALQAGAAGADAETAAALAEGRAVPLAGPVRVGVVLPLGGSPAFQAFAEEVLEGVEAAVSAWDLDGAVELLVLDDAGDPAEAAELVRAAEEQGAVAVVGLLEDSALIRAAASRNVVPLVSPTAYEVPEGEEGVFSLNTFDPAAAESLAEWAATSGIRQVVVIHASSGVSADEARVFSREFQDRGGSVLRSFAYEPGATFWEEQILGAAALRPEALVLPVPPEDLPGMAPQVTFFGLDTLGIRILGTGGWTDPRTLQDVDPRHTDGVVVATPVRPDSAGEGYTRFREAYQGRFRRSLVDGVVQALGYDAASLVFHGIYAGADSPGEVADALARLANLPGATGDLSVTEGELRRRHHLVCFDARVQYPILPAQLPEQLYRAYPPDEETGIVPEGPGRPNGFQCPLPMDAGAPGDTIRTPGAAR